jgi:molecular chaperone DnaK
MASDNKTLGRFILDGIPPAPRGIPQVEVTFDIDANGILSVSAKDKATNKIQSVRIEASTQLSKDEIEKLKNEAAIHAEEDKKKREEAEVKNQAEQLVYLAEKNLNEWKDKISADIRSSIEKKIADLKDAVSKNDIESIKTASAELSGELQKIGQSMYTKGNEGEQAPNN